MMVSERPTPIAFVIIPFSDEFDVIFTQLIRPSLPGYDVIRADSRLDQQNILKKIVEGISGASLVIADVSTLNPNVMYELGAAHALRKPTIMISQNIASLPFDLRSYPVQLYSTHFSTAAELTARLNELSEKHAQGLLKFGNPIGDFMPAADTSPSPPTVPINDAERTVSGLPEDYGYLDHAADMEEFGGKATFGFAKLNQLNSALTTKLNTIAPKLQRARASGAARDVRDL